MRRLLALVLAPLALAVMMPLALAFVVLFYVNVQMRALIALVSYVLHRNAELSEPLQRPHFLDTPTPKVTQE